MTLQEEISSLKLRTVLRGHKDSITCVKFSPDGRFLITGSADQCAMLWDIQRGIFFNRLDGHTGGISAVAWSADSSKVCTGSDDHTIKVWDVESGKLLVTMEGHKGFVFCLDYSKVDDIIISGSFDNSIKLWDAKTGTCFRTVAAHSDPVTSVAFNKTGSLYASGSYDGLCRIWDEKTGHCVKTLVPDEPVPISSVEFSPNGKFILISTHDNVIRLWNFAQAKPLKSYRGHKLENYCTNATFAVRNGQCGVLSGSADGSIILWDLQRKSVLQKLSKQHHPVLCVDAHPHEPLIVSGLLSEGDNSSLCHIFGPEAKADPVLISAPQGIVKP